MVELRNKGRWRKKLWILLGCAIAAILILTLLREREPQYQGRSLGTWVLQLELRDPRYLDGSSLAQEAIQHIGTNALPFLLKWIQYQEPPWRRRLATFCARLPHKLADPLSSFVVGHGYIRQQGAFSALYVLGPDAEAAIPALTRLIETPSPSAVSSMTVLAHLGDKGLAPILAALTNQSGPYRILAVSALASRDAKNTFNQTVASALTGCLGDTNREVALCAAQILCCNNIHDELVMRTFLEALGSDRNQEAVVRLRDCLTRGFPVSMLIQFLQDTNSPLSSYAAGALGGMAENDVKLPETVLPALTNSLHDPRPLVRSYAADAVGRFKEAAEPAAPALLDLWNDSDEWVRRSATNAFFALPSYYVLTHPTQPQGPAGISQEQADMYERRYGIRSFSSAGTRLLDHPDIRIRQMATNAFRKLSGSNVVNQTSENASHQP
jgi:hypothetical protein